MMLDEERLRQQAGLSLVKLVIYRRLALKACFT